MTEYEDYQGAEHTHRQQIPFVTWALVVCVVLLATGLLVVSVHIDNRQSKSNGKFQRLDNSVCSLLALAPPGKYPPIDHAVALNCKPPRKATP